MIRNHYSCMQQCIILQIQIHCSSFFSFAAHNHTRTLYTFPTLSSLSVSLSYICRSNFVPFCSPLQTHTAPVLPLQLNLHSSSKSPVLHSIPHFISYPLVTCRTFSASFLAHLFILCGPALTWSSGSNHMLACDDLELSLCWIVEKKCFCWKWKPLFRTFCLGGNDLTCILCFLLFCWLFPARNTFLYLHFILHTISVQCVLIFYVYFCAVSRDH